MKTKPHIAFRNGIWHVFRPFYVKFDAEYYIKIIYANQFADKLNSLNDSRAISQK